MRYGRLCCINLITFNQVRFFSFDSTLKKFKCFNRIVRISRRLSNFNKFKNYTLKHDRKENVRKTTSIRNNPHVGTPIKYETNFTQTPYHIHTIFHLGLARSTRHTKNLNTLKESLAKRSDGTKRMRMATYSYTYKPAHGIPLSHPPGFPDLRYIGFEYYCQGGAILWRYYIREELFRKSVLPLIISFMAKVLPSRLPGPAIHFPPVVPASREGLMKITFFVVLE